MKEFGESNYMARQAKKLIMEKGSFGKNKTVTFRSVPQASRKEKLCVLHECRRKESNLTEKTNTVQPQRGISAL